MKISTINQARASSMNCNMDNLTCSRQATYLHTIYVKSHEIHILSTIQILDWTGTLLNTTLIPYLDNKWKNMVLNLKCYFCDLATNHKIWVIIYITIATSKCWISIRTTPKWLVTRWWVESNGSWSAIGYL